MEVKFKCHCYRQNKRKGEKILNLKCDSNKMEVSNIV